MNKSKNTKSIKKYIFWGIFPLILFLIALIYIVGNHLYKDNNFSVLEYPHSKKIFNNYKNSELYSHDIISGEFKAKENNLGILAIRFSILRKTNSNFTFKIKEKRKKDWYYVGEYKSKEFGGYPLFPFGFPVILQSENKIYNFELESVSEKGSGGLAISEIEPIVVTKYKFSKKELLEDKMKLVDFLGKKTLVAVGNKEFFLKIASTYVQLIVIYISTLILFWKGKKSTNLLRLLMKKKKEVHLFKKFIVFPTIIAIFLSGIILLAIISNKPLELAGMPFILSKICIDCEAINIINKLYVFLFLIVCIVFLFFIRKYLVLRTLHLFLLFFFVLSPNLSIVHLFLPLILGSFFHTTWFYFYCIVVFIFLIKKQFSLQFFSFATFQYCWMFVCFWFISELFILVEPLKTKLKLIEKKIKKINIWINNK